LKTGAAGGCGNHAGFGGLCPYRSKGMQFGGYAVAIVLIVEDEDQVRVLAESFLQGEGHTTLSAATVDQAVALLESEDPIDVLFADVAIQDDPEAKDVFEELRGAYVSLHPAIQDEIAIVTLPMRLECEVRERQRRLVRR